MEDGLKSFLGVFWGTRKKKLEFVVSFLELIFFVWLVGWFFGYMSVYVGWEVVKSFYIVYN